MMPRVGREVDARLNPPAEIELRSRAGREAVSSTRDCESCARWRA